MRILKKLYEYWLAFGHAIGVVMTPIQLFIVYALVFGPARLVTLVTGKDLLDRRMRPAPSFWKPKESRASSLEEARRQF